SSCAVCHRHLHSFPTRRSSDLSTIIAFFPFSTWLASCSSRRMLRCDSDILVGERCSWKLVWSSRSSGVRALRTTAVLARRCQRRSEEHTSELQSRFDLVCRLLL